MRSCYESVTTKAAEILHLEKYGIYPGAKGDLVILQCKDPIEALRLKPTRLFVIRKGKIISSTPPVEYKLFMGETIEKEDLLFKNSS